MDITLYKRARDGKKINAEVKTKAVKLKFRERDVDLEKNIYIGRNKTCTVSIENDPLISRKHALIEHVKGTYYISDLDSMNGTYVNNHPVKKNEKVELAPGDVIKVGKTKLNVV
ncbi:MAG: FHA domain-containing protein [Spirochaetes bacterium]|nr:FHA domain-containing protein [Spirochaetota bacterium]